MIVLKDGTMLYSEDTARDYLVACGFDCPQLQLPELVHLINKKERDELQDALDEALWSLEDAQDRADELHVPVCFFESLRLCYHSAIRT